MESSTDPWLSEMEQDSPIFTTGQFNFTEPFDEELAAILESNFESCLFSDDNSPPPPRSPALVDASLTTNPISTSFSTSSTPIVLNFGNASSQFSQHTNSGAEEDFIVSQTLLRSKASKVDPQKEKLECTENLNRTTLVRPPASQTYDHNTAERKRREVLSRHFLSLSTMIPGLKKMDKTSVLGDTISYLKNLQEKVTTLEEQATKWSLESTVLVKKSRIAAEDGESSRNLEEQPLPEIEARISGTQILIRIQCENRKGLLAHLICQVENFNLNIVNTNIITFATFALEITVTAKMEKEFNITTDELLKRLHDAIMLYESE